MRNGKVLVLGGLGFIGSNLAQELTRLGVKVTIYDACLDPYGWNFANIKEIKDGVEFIKGDIRDFDLLSTYVKDKEYIFHCAAQLGQEISMANPFLDIDINCRGTMNLLEACRKVNREAKIVYMGTRVQVGELVYLPVDERHSDNPQNIYGINKLTAEKYLLLYYKLYGIPCTSLRLSNVYGHRCQMRHGHYAVLNYFLRLAMEDKVITVYGEGNQTRDFIYIDDVVTASILAAQSPSANGEVFIVGSGKETKLIDAVKLILDIVGKGTYVHIPFPPERERIDIKRFVASYAKLKEILGWQPRTHLEEGIRKTYNFYKERLNEYV
jgi:UDP-glucose 4-epimerase